MDTQQLQAFTAVADANSFSHAAEHLHLTQPAVSKRIKALEADLGQPLFQRLGRTIELTEAGTLLLPRARRLLWELTDARNALQDLSGAVSGTLTLATSHHIGLHRLPGPLQRFSHANPEVRLSLHFMDSEEAHDLVLHGQVELAVVTLAPGGHPTLGYQRLWPDPLRFVVAANHPLAKQQLSGLADLAAWPAILPGPETYTGRIVAERFRAAGTPLTEVMSTNYLETIRTLVAVGLGWSVLPATMEGPVGPAGDADTADLVLLNLPGGNDLHRDLGVVQHPDRQPSRAARAFIDALGVA